jgi:hypothetical protein
VRSRLLRFGLYLSLLAFSWPLALRAVQTTWTVPGVINAPGLNGTHFVSDVTATNPGTAPANVSLTFLPTGAIQTATLAPGQTVVYQNVIGVLFGLSGAVGALTVSSDQPLLLRARTYNDAASGTYGVALPVVEDSRLLSAGDTADTFWIDQDAASTSGYRTNIAVVFPDGGGSAIVTVFDSNGVSAGQHVFEQDSAGFLQVSAGSFAGAVPLGRANILVTRGRATAYAVVADNVTGDSSLFTFGDLPGGIQDVLINGVARVNGKNNTFFRTDGRFYNPTDTDATVNVAFHASGNSNASPATKSFTVPAGKVIEVIDVLNTLLALPVGSTGALRFQSQWPVAVVCRTSNVDPTGVKPGTFGSQQTPVPLLSFQTSADGEAAVTGIRQNSSFRTNVGFAAGADGATCALTLETAGGNTVGSASVTQGSFGWTQFNVPDLFPGVQIPEDATLVVRVTQGSVDVYDASVDNSSGDSVVTPIALLPVNLASSATIGPSGGSLRSADGRFTLRVPAGALAQPVTLSFQPGTNDATLGLGSAYQLAPGNVTFAKPALLTLAYGADDVVSNGADALSLVANAGSGWVVLGGGSVDHSLRTLTVLLSSTTPAPPSSARATPLAVAGDSGGATFGAATSWVMVPSGRQAVPVGGHLQFKVQSTGASSSTSPSNFLLSRSPSDVEVTWLVDNEIGGNIIDGTIDPVPVSTTYDAPGCPPPRNPATISANIDNGGVFSLPYRVKSYARVRILYRNWTFTTLWDQVFKCPLAFAGDHVRYTAGFSFSLNDNLNVMNVVSAPQVREFVGSPTACDHTNVDLTRLSSPFLQVMLEAGAYDPKADEFDLTLDWVFPTALGYSYFSVAQDGSRFPGTFGPGPAVPVPGIDFMLNEGDFPHQSLVPSANALWDWDLEHVPTASCQ